MVNGQKGLFWSWNTYIYKPLILKKVDAKANKKEQATLNFKNIKEVFIDDEKFEDDFRKLYKQMDANYKKWLSYDRKAFKLNSVKDMDGLIKMVENIKSDRMTKWKWLMNSELFDKNW